MNIEHSELAWLDEQHDVTLEDLVELSGLSSEELQYLVESGALTPISQTEEKPSEDWYFSSHCVISIRTLSRLKRDFELEPNSLGLMLVFLERIRTLEFKLCALDHKKIENDAE
ncbi:MAG: chaperone modulator CbpM [Methylotenera sp.]